MRKYIRRLSFAAASFAAFAGSSLAADYPVDSYRDNPGGTYQREAPVYEREYLPPAPRVTLLPPRVMTPMVVETIVVPAPMVIRRPVVYAYPRAVINYPPYAAPRRYAYGAYAVRRHGPMQHPRFVYRGGY